MSRKPLTQHLVKANLLSLNHPNQQSSILCKQDDLKNVSDLIPSEKT